MLNHILKQLSCMFFSRRNWLLTGGILWSSTLFLTCHAQQLYTQFLDPPQEARPRVWWHWMNGNVTQDGIYKDLMWMNRVGISGFHNFDAGTVSPQVVKKRLIYMDEGWKDAFRYATHLADSLKMEIAVASAPGWSNTGGPWVKPEQAMKKLTWRESIIEIKKNKNKKTQNTLLHLPAPFRTTGFFQNVPPADNATEFANATVSEEWYRDIAVIAVRLNDTEKTMEEMGAKVTSSGGNFTLEQLTDGDLNKSSDLPVEETRGYAWIQYEFPVPTTIKALSIVDGLVRDEWACNPAAVSKHLEASDDGVYFRQVCDIPHGGTYRQTVDIPETTARYFRMRFDNPVANGYYDAFYGVTPKRETKISELVLYPVSKIHHAEEKAGFATPHDMMENVTPEEKNVSVLTDVFDITDKMDAEGNITWDAPEGTWRIYRFGYSLTGKKNHPAPPEATGLEVDKLDKEAVRDYITYYINMYKDASGNLMGKRGLQYLLIDSYEAGWETWTAKMAQEFEHRRGYSVLQWLPVLTGQIIESTEKSEQFLWDWRKTIGELIAENLYAEVEKVAAEYGLQCYFESHENGRMYLVDGIEAKKRAAVPMAAMWALEGAGGANHTMSECDIRESAAVAHLYGQNIVALESFTSNGLGNRAYTFYPGNLKYVADLAMSCGVNRFVIHESAHQPVDDKKPGLGLLIFGQWFNRHETWAEQAKAWTDYLARSSFMLQQGRYVADVLYYYGEDNSITGLFAHQLPSIAEGYSFDYVNADALLNEVSFADNKYTTRSGMSYRLLVLDKNARKMSLPVLHKIAELVKQGAVICGQKPQQEPSLKGNKAEFQRLVEDIWETGRKNVFTETPMTDVLKRIGITQDFIATDMKHLKFVHRTTDHSDIYWINNRTDNPRTVHATFRVSGRKPMLWHPETGKTEAISYTLKEGVAKVSFNMVANDAVFIVFNDKADNSELILPVKTETEWCTINTPWKVTFPRNTGAPEETIFNRLIPLTESTVNGIKYFSGTATYTNTFKLSQKDWKRGQFLMDLGKVGVLAEVIINGKSLGILWKAPYQLDITEALRKGYNDIEIRVTNLWVNRIIGDKALGESYTFPAFDFYTAESPLLPSGLIGPVKIITRN